MSAMMVAPAHCGCSLPARDGWDDPQLIVLLDRCLYAIQIAHVLLAQKDVDETPQRPVIEQVRFEVGILGDQVAQPILDGCAAHRHAVAVARVGSQGCRNANVSHTCAYSSSDTGWVI